MSTEEEQVMRGQKQPSAVRLTTIGGLIVGAVGIAILWMSGVPFPIYPPPGIIILLVGALIVGLTPWRWAPIVGTLLGLFVFTGFLISPTGLSNLFGQAGLAVAIGQGIQILGVLTALIAGAFGTWTNYRKRAQTSA
jgi:hypothetical protein